MIAGDMMTHRLHRRRLIMVLVMGAATLLACSRTHAQVSNLDDGRFIQGLADRGMQDLLLYYLEKANIQDPVLRLEIQIAQGKLLFQNTAAAVEARAGALDSVLDGYRKLIDADPNHWKRLYWKSDMVEYVLTVILPAGSNKAGMFYEFGLPSGAQRERFEQLVPLIATTIKSARDDWWQLQGDLPRDPDFEFRFNNTGEWRRMRVEFGELKVPLYESWANLYLNMTPEAAKDKEAFEQRIGLADSELKKLREQPNLNDATIAQIDSLRGRFRLMAGAPAEALPLLDTAINTPDLPPDILLTARLARAMALHQQNKTDEAIQYLEEIRREFRDKDLVRADPFSFILTYEAEYRMHKLTADAIKDPVQQKAKMDEAYAVFKRLIDDPAIEKAGLKAEVEGFINDVLLSQSGGEVKDVATEQPMKVLAGISKLMREADEAMAAAQQASGDEQQQLQKQARELYLKIRGMITTFIGRSDLPEANEAQARFELGKVYYQLNETYNASVAWYELCEKFPAQPLSGRAIGFAATMAKDVWTAHPQEQQAVHHFDRVMKLLIEKYPGTEAAQLFSYTYGGFLRQQKRFAEAVENYEKVPATHPFYAEAQYEKIVAMHAQWQTSDDTRAKERLVTAILDAGRAAQPTLAKARQGAPADRSKALQRAQGDLLTIEAEVLAAAGRLADALERLDGFEQKFADHPDLINQALRTQIAINVQRGKIAEARDVIQTFVKQFPEQGGPLINGVLQSIHQRTTDLDRIGNKAEAQQLRDIGAELAKFLLDWAGRQPELQAPDKLLPYQLIYGRQLIASNKASEAVALFEQAHATPSGQQNVDVKDALAEAYFATGQYDKCAPLDNDIIKDANQRQSLEEKNAPVVWKTWLRTLLRQDIRYEEAKKSGDTKAASNISQAQIYRRILILEQQQNGTLGGSQFKDEFIRLKVKHAPK